MNNGATESSYYNRPKIDEFPQSLARIAVAQICESVGLHGIQHSALDTLSDIVCKYVQEIGKTSNLYANLAGRTESNLVDLVQGLEELGMTQGFLGAADLDHCLSESGVVKEITRYVAVTEEVGFAFSVPDFPVVKERELRPSFYKAGEIPPVDNVPPWLPCFPDPETYISTDLAIIEQDEARNDGIEQDQRDNLPPLLETEQRLSSNELLVPELGSNGVSEREQVNNPFLATPLEYGEKEVSLVPLPAGLLDENLVQNHGLWPEHVLAVGTSASPVIGFKNRDVDIEEGVKEAAVERKPAVRLEFHTVKKSLATDNRRSKVGNAEVLYCFANGDLRVDKKMKIGKAVKESLENGKHIEMMQL
uniref:transcription initiation factor TFIID subunit 3-like n=1 Tax=Erigeron canadensis TaxID=72917 RepID=UPI001CB9A406|nr:transcription initiation factor TFIID subunit 3-like [Erigeron canadensis]